MPRRLSFLFLMFAAALGAHIGSPDVYYEGTAGPYRLLVTVRPPVVIPGVAQIEIRSASPAVTQMRIVPLPLTGPGAKFAPAPDVAQRSKEDPRYFTGALWIMSVGAWQVRVEASGEQGRGELSVPVPALPTRIKGMDKALGALLLVLMLILAAGLVSIVGAGVREGQLEPGRQPDAARKRRARVVMAVAAAVVFAGVYLGNRWWGSEASYYSRRVYKPLELATSLEPGGRLVLRMKDPGWLRRRVDDLLPDHGHLMHMFLIRLPEMERICHLHPEQIGAGVFAQNLPDLPAGRYQIFADIVHESGVPETPTVELDLPDVHGKPLSGDDAEGLGPPLSAADKNRTVAELEGGGRMVWERGSAPLGARQPAEFRFRIEDAEGRPVQDLELYMGMQGHAAFVRADRTVFAHVHPAGSVSMAALSLVTPDNPHASHMRMAMIPPVVSFPYGLPRPGDYRIFVQIKRGGRILTGIFDAHVEN